jgi:hypothetical protein
VCSQVATGRAVGRRHDAYARVVGGKSAAWFHHGTQALADVLPSAQHSVLDGQTHMVKPKALAPLLVEFFTSGDGASAENLVAPMTAWPRA